MLQLWGLLRELCTLAASLHPIARARFYRALAARGLTRALARAAAEPGATGALATVQVRALDVLLLLLNHDPSVVRLSATSDDAEEGTGAAWGGARPDGRALVGRLLALLGYGCDEGVLVQASEAARILLDTSGMEPSEQNAFLDQVYSAGHMAGLVSALHTRASEALAATSSPSDGSGSGPMVVRIEALLDVLGSCFGQHGYRSQRLLSEPTIWEAMRDLLRGRRGSLRATTTRLVRNLLAVQPGCAAKVAEYGLLAPMLGQLMRYDKPNHDCLGNSAVLALLSQMCEAEELAELRAHLVSAHRAQLQTLASANAESHPARALLVLADAEAIDRASGSAPLSPRAAARPLGTLAAGGGPAAEPLAASGGLAADAPPLEGALDAGAGAGLGSRDGEAVAALLSASEHEDASDALPPRLERELAALEAEAAAPPETEPGEEENLPPGASPNSQSNSPNSPRPTSPSKPAAVLVGGQTGPPVSGLTTALGGGRPLTPR